jgi:hypothetical protein
MFTLNTFAVVFTGDASGARVIARCHNRATAELLARKFHGYSVAVAAPGALFTADVSDHPAVQALVAR